jgi:hypothetical protein
MLKKRQEKYRFLQMYVNKISIQLIKRVRGRNRINTNLQMLDHL